jgi:hypothetical protein
MPSRSRLHAKGLADAAAGVQCSLRSHAKAKKNEWLTRIEPMTQSSNL